MDNVFSEIGLDIWDFGQVSAYFLLTMLIFFGVKNKRYSWLKPLSLVTFVLLCLLLILFRSRLPIRLFASIMLITTLIVETASNKRRRLSDI